MKIGIDGRVLARYKHSGVEEYTENLLRELVTLAPHHEFRILLNDARARHPLFTYLRSFPHVRIAEYRIPERLLDITLAVTDSPKLDRLIGGVDVFFEPNLNFVALSPAVPLVTVVHDISFDLFPEFLTMKKRLWHWGLDPRRLFRRATRIVSVSRSTRDDLVRFAGVPKEKIVIIYPGIDQSVSRPSDTVWEGLKDRYRLPERYRLFLGTREPRKNLATLLTAYQRCDVDIPLVIAGERGWLERDLGETLKGGTVPPLRRDSPSSARMVIRIGSVAGEERAVLIQHAAVLVTASWYEGFGLPVAEAMLARVPVVVSHTGSLPEVAGDSALLIDPRKPALLGAAINELLHGGRLRERLIAKGRENTQRFNWQRSAKEVLRVMEEVVGESRYS